MLNLTAFPKQLLLVGAFLFFQVLIFGADTVRAQTDNFLSIGLAGGWAVAPDAELKSNPSFGDADFASGYSLKAALGFTLAQKFQLEAEYLYTFNRIDSILNPPTVTPLSVSDRVTNSLMLNATYRMETPPLGDVNWIRRGFFLYFGGGVGLAWQDYTVETIGTGTDSSLAWQILLGFEKMNPSSHLFASFPSPFLQYRFLHINKGDFGAFEADASLHLIEFGFRFYGSM